MIVGTIASAIKRARGLTIITANGGESLDRIIDNTPYRVHTFTESGTFTVIDGTSEIDYLIIGGGGGGGRYNTGGGGGAGEIKAGTITVSPGVYEVVVGNGGAGATVLSGSNGEPSSVFGLTALGGGGGGGGASSINPEYTGKDGANGGGGGGTYSNSTNSPPGAGNPGNAGGYGYYTAGTNSRRGGGGGSMAEPGWNGNSAGYGRGGVGTYSNIDGNRNYYGSGGSGGANSATSVVAEVGGGGRGAGSSGSAHAGRPNTGGGGGGAGDNSRTPGAGGSGIVILRYRSGDDIIPEDPLYSYVTSLILPTGDAGTDVIDELKSTEWTLPAAGAVTIIESTSFPSGKALSIPGGPSNSFSTLVDLSVGNFCIEMEIAFISWAGRGYAIPILQYGVGSDGSDGFGLSVFTVQTSAADLRKRVYLRNGYGDIASRTFEALAGDPVYIAIHFIAGQMYLSVNGSNWGAPISGYSIGSGAKLLTVGNMKGSWLQTRLVHLGAFRLTQNATRYTRPYVPPSLPYPYYVEPVIEYARGGTITDIDVDGTMYRVHTFTETEDLTILSSTLEVEYVVVAGGGSGGGTNTGGGGGAGGLLQGTRVFASGIYGVTVGNGGIVPDGWSSIGINGEDSSLDDIVAIGGGGGGRSTVNGSGAGNSGGSGGGSGGRWAESTIPIRATGIIGQGNDGGIWTLGQSIGTTDRTSGGGGGAGEPGDDAAGNTAANGGDGLMVTIRGVEEYFAGGGGGGTNGGSGGLGGIGGGGKGAARYTGSDWAPAPGLPSTGGGGGGGSEEHPYGEDGGSGIVIVRYAI